MAWAGSTGRQRLPKDWPTIVRHIKRRDGYRCTMVYETTGRCSMRGIKVDGTVTKIVLELIPSRLEIRGELADGDHREPRAGFRAKIV
jgi:hypothetical protein